MALNLTFPQSPVEKLCHAVTRVFPELGEFAGISAEMPIADVWQQLCQLTHSTPAEFAEKLALVAHCKVAGALDQLPGHMVSQLPQIMAQTFCVLPLRDTEDGLVFAVANPFDDWIIERIRLAWGRPFVFEIASPAAIDAAIVSAYKLSSAEEGARTGTLVWDSAGKPLDMQKAPEHAVQRLARELIMKAIGMRASDMHFQPFGNAVAVRVRVDGFLQRLVLLSSRISQALIRYFQTQSGMDISNPLIPQDGRMSLVIGESEFDLRLSVIPVGGGTRLVIRFLDQGRAYSLADAGFSLKGIHSIRRMANRAAGVMLLTGPTGSGKTSTLYGVLSELNKVSSNLMTVENPIEYRLQGVSQIEVNPKVGLTFAAALRTILRQDPDVILIGEIRDEETARIAMQSALTGHLVLSTLHTNDAFSSIARLVDLGISPAILADALAGVVSQRLLRCLCEHCKQPVESNATPENALFHKITRSTAGANPVGCAKCNQTGYFGRIPVTEIFEMNPAIVALIASGCTDAVTLREAAGDDFQLMAVAASRRIISGDTTVQEAVRVMGRRFWHELVSEYGNGGDNLSAAEHLINASQEGKALAVLLAGEDSAGYSVMESALHEAWFTAQYAASPDQAKDALKSDDTIHAVVLDIPDHLSDEQVLQYVSDYRRAMAWSRLPALMLLPTGRSDLEPKLIADGAISKMLEKPVQARRLVEWISMVSAEI